jgi:hypothetical protein
VTAKIIYKRTVAYNLQNLLQKLRRFVKDYKKKVKLCFCLQKKKTDIKKVFINNFKAKDLGKK